jgi:hypothetical protein
MRADSGELRITVCDSADCADAAEPYCRHPWLLYSPSTVLVYQFNMSAKSTKLARLFVVAIASALVLSGCATATVDESTFFVDPARYAMYDCKQLAPVRQTATKRIEELQGLMTKAETGPAGSIVSEMAYRPDYVSAQATLKSANAAWERNRCESAGQSGDPSFARPSPGMEPTAGRSKSRVY